VHVHRGEEVLEGLVFRVAEPGLLVREPGQALCVFARRLRHRIDDAVDLLLRHLGEPALCLPGPRREGAGLLDREEVLVLDRHDGG
jgi:hypothetical protein